MRPARTRPGLGSESRALCYRLGVAVFSHICPPAGPHSRPTNPSAKAPSLREPARGRPWL